MNRPGPTPYPEPSAHVNSQDNGIKFLDGRSFFQPPPALDPRAIIVNPIPHDLIFGRTAVKPRGGVICQIIWSRDMVLIELLHRLFIIIIKTLQLYTPHPHLENRKCQDAFASRARPPSTPPQHLLSPSRLFLPLHQEEFLHLPLTSKVFQDPHPTPSRSPKTRRANLTDPPDCIPCSSHRTPPQSTLI